MISDTAGNFAFAMILQVVLFLCCFFFLFPFSFRPIHLSFGHIGHIPLFRTTVNSQPLYKLALELP